MTINLRKHKQTILLFGTVFVLTGVCFYLFKDTLLHQDENPHFQSIEEIYTGNITFQTYARHAVLPGFHYVMVGWTTVIGHLSFATIRLFEVIIAILTTTVFYFLAGKIDPAHAKSKTLLFYFFPFSFPVYYLIYTDILSLGLLMVALYFTLNRAYFFSFLVGIATILVRQNNLLWLAFFCAYIYVDNYGYEPITALWKNPRQLMHFTKLIKNTHLFPFLQKIWLFILIAVVCVIIVVKNGSPVALESINRPAIVSFSFGNIFLFLITFFFLFLPLHVYNYPKVVSLLKSRPKFRYLLFTLFILFMIFFREEFFYSFNTAEFLYFPEGVLLLKNSWLHFIGQNELIRALFFMPVFYAISSIVVTPLKNKHAYLIYPFTLLILSQYWLIDPRYFIVPTALFILFFKIESRPVFLGIACLFIVCAITIYSGILANWWFL